MAIFQSGGATWRNKDVDQPVNVVEDLGVGPDGRRYAKVEGSNSGIPLDEIHYTDTSKINTTKTSKIPKANTPNISNVSRVIKEADEYAEIFKPKASKLASKASEAIPIWAKNTGLIMGGIVLAATALDYGQHLQDKNTMRRQLNIQEENRKTKQKEYDSFDKKVYYNLQDLNGLPQELYDNRNKSTTTWGGKKY